MITVEAPVKPAYTITPLVDNLIYDKTTALSPEDTLVIRVEAYLRDKFRDRQRGRLIAKLISSERDRANHSGFQKDPLLSELSKYCSGRNLTRFMALLRENPTSTTPLVESLLVNRIHKTD